MAVHISHSRVYFVHVTPDFQYSLGALMRKSLAGKSLMVSSLATAAGIATNLTLQSMIRY